MLCVIATNCGFPYIKSEKTEIFSQGVFKIEPFTTLPKGSIPSQKCKFKIALQKILKFQFYATNK